VTTRVLVVEDEPVAAEAHAAYTNRVAGFEVAGVAHSVGETLRMLQADPAVDVLLLDMHLPDGHGLGLLQRLRAAGHPCDVIAVTAARDADVVRAAATLGVVQYLIKPFTFPTFRAKLEQYADYRAQLAAAPEQVAQHEVDRMLGSLRPSVAQTPLPKGMTPETLEQVTTALREGGEPLSAAEVAERVGSSRVTARRYLEHLADTRAAERRPRYGRSGRPEVEYRWLS
jgi:response regulator of citrate/malate metabolism